ncbi:L,D-transpeptidase family protein [Vibrio taketomensis]|uniref:L,D-transpeptidase family protein n=1 Tax=Vibrio taketomensis TaxID=2572923 RepID=UPI001389F8B0|nr:L,D-transpeptidase family protein [Vibrio taketomensis]
MKILLLILITLLSASVHAEIDKVTVDKSKRRLYIIENDQVIHEFRIALGKRPIGHKVYEGDQRTPEGSYKLEHVMEDSQFYRSIHISYPNQDDIANAVRLKVNPGGNIKIHGQKNGEVKPSQFVQSFDWTDGCIALSNEDMDQLLALVTPGTPIEILP